MGSRSSPRPSSPEVAPSSYLEKGYAAVKALHKPRTTSDRRNVRMAPFSSKHGE
jgi:hypothetical protein